MFKKWLESSENFDNCYEKACHYAKKHNGKVYQVVGPIGKFPNANSKWLEIPQKNWIHYVTVIDDLVYDWTFNQFDPTVSIPLTYKVSELKSKWNKIYPEVKNLYEIYDEYSFGEKAWEIARQRIHSCKGFEDLSNFHVMFYTNEELKELGEKPGNWVGQYVKGSIDSSRGCTVLINLSKHKTIIELVETMLHEVGHGLWELLDNQAKKEWLSNKMVKLHSWGGEEAFSDEFMHFVLGQYPMMYHKELFTTITQVK